MPASQASAGVGKSGSPAEREITSIPWLANSAARVPMAIVGESLTSVGLIFFLFLRGLTVRFGQIRLDEFVNLPVHDPFHVGGFVAGAVVFHQRVGLEDVGADLA